MMSDDYAGLRMPQAQVRDERLRIASEMLALTLKTPPSCRCGNSSKYARR